jgi:hypothetical protein
MYNFLLRNKVGRPLEKNGKWTMWTEKPVIPRLLQMGDKQGERYFPKANAGWPTSDEDVIAMVNSQ